ncbi:MAG: hypothetical protein IKF11_10595 [Methanobrevibacter sp.]|nr:hypothetical protein [Methanobrevibacter sp.]
MEGYNVYVTGFIEKIKFFNSPAYPNIRTVLNAPEKSVANMEYNEWYDFTIDYDEDTLSL